MWKYGDRPPNDHKQLADILHELSKKKAAKKLPAPPKPPAKDT